VNFLINYDFATSDGSKAYVNRIRNMQQRMKGDGFAITFFTPENILDVQEFMETLKAMKQVRKLV
jgi:hypothetical protein